MYRTILGEEGFKKGMKLYFERHDGQAVTCDDFRAAMADANEADLSQFENWYTQAGTPTVHVSHAYDEEGKKLTLTLKQVAPSTPGQSAEDKKPWHIPVEVGLLSAATGAEIVSSKVLQFKEAEQTFTFDEVAEKPVLSVFRGFSAPVKIKYDAGSEQTNADLAFLMAHDTDTFNRWDAGDRLFTNVIMGLSSLETADVIASAEVSQELVDAIRTSLNNAANTDSAMLSAALTPPDRATLSQNMDVVDVDRLVAATKRVRKTLGAALKSEFEAVYAATAGAGDYEFNSKETGRRRLRNTCLDYICSDGSAESALVAKAHYDSANCMTDKMAGFRALSGRGDDCAEKGEVIADFYNFAKDDALVLNKWFSVQAMADTPDALSKVQALKGHKDFNISNPNRCRSLFTFFAANMPHFHAGDGAGYKFVAEAIVELDKLNPQVAARMTGSFSQWKRFDSGRQALMKAQLEMIQGTEGLSKDTYEVATRCLK
jgi:aminopeptidase N